MTLDDYNTFCASLPHSSHVVQWGGAHVWKIGGRVFAIAGWNDGEALAVTFKCSPMSFDLPKEQPGLRPAPYLASRGMAWIQRTSNDSMDDAALRD
jgi:predicted DNA-binding protein (MmcQ/YjbR family)